jgi:hypothetical protein
MKAYRNFDPDGFTPDQEDLLDLHIEKMTSEGLHSKVEIAMELAIRDDMINTLKAKVLAEINNLPTNEIWKSDIDKLIGDINKLRV